MRPVEGDLIHEGIDASVNCFGVSLGEVSLRIQMDLDSVEVVAMRVEASEDNLVASNEGESIEWNSLEA